MELSELMPLAFMALLIIVVVCASVISIKTKVEKIRAKKEIILERGYPPFHCNTFGKPTKDDEPWLKIGKISFSESSNDQSPNSQTS
ncbi:hypothetical protein GBO34_00900 [Roseivirga pacifica]|uniref:hypothetical protein n=1 Tax=Roseivirga pacifica TaxID=1267423 RepID=UPI00209599B5|nr:hypothetical protein [Roseivirga pacifica]MCO6367871.1 hypothetical protein [Roseivirga pacifica]MCO6377243.1 hypothetical protein [Roseivirga pacifica]